MSVPMQEGSSDIFKLHSSISLTLQEPVLQQTVDMWNKKLRKLGFHIDKTWHYGKFALSPRSMLLC